MTEQQQRFQRSPVFRLFAAELKETTVELQKNSEDQYEKQYFLLPSGVAVSKVMVIGTAVEKEDVGQDQPFWRIRVADATGGIAVYAGQYQAEAAQVIAGMQVPCFVAVVGKPSVYRPDGGPVVSIRPDSVIIVDEQTRSSFTIDAARQLVARAAAMKTHAEDVMIQKARAAYPNITSNSLLLMADQALKSLLAPEEQQTPAGGEQTPTKDVQKEPATDDTPPAEQKSPEKQKEKAAKKNSSPPAKAKPEQGMGSHSGGRGAAPEPFASGTKELADTLDEILQKEGALNIGGISRALKEKGITTYMDPLEEALRLLIKEGRIFEPKVGTFKAA